LLVGIANTSESVIVVSQRIVLILRIFIKTTFYVAPISLILMLIMIPILFVDRIVIVMYALFFALLMSVVIMFFYSLYIAKKAYKIGRFRLLFQALIYILLLNGLSGYFLYYRLNFNDESINYRLFRW